MKKFESPELEVSVLTTDEIANTSTPETSSPGEDA